MCCCISAVKVDSLDPNTQGRSLLVTIDRIMVNESLRLDRVVFESDAHDRYVLKE